jgi:phage-related baseplate assembly protein
MELAQKLQLKAGSQVALLGVPSDLEIQLPDDYRVTTDANTADVVVAFVQVAGDLDGAAAALVIDAARLDKLSWLAYPKAGQLGTDLNRDRLASAVRVSGVQPVRQISIDDVWSALRLRACDQGR